LPTAVLADELPDSDALQQDAALIGEITLDKATVFDLTNPKENNWLYRWANRVHVMTREDHIKEQLLFNES